jgi:bisphosphoglycerate-independent phosphoglycerate mutase (AlkP superfamily)
MIQHTTPTLPVGQLAYVTGKFYVIDKDGKWRPKMQACQTKPPRKKP